MMHAVEANLLAIGAAIATVFDLNVGHGSLLPAGGPVRCAALAQHRRSPVSSTIGPESLHFSHARGGFRSAPASARFAPFLIESRQKSRPRAVPGPRSSNGNRTTKFAGRAQAGLFRHAR